MSFSNQLFCLTKSLFNCILEERSVLLMIVGCQNPLLVCIFCPVENKLKSVYFKTKHRKIEQNPEAGRECQMNVNCCI